MRVILLFCPLFGCSPTSSWAEFEVPEDCSVSSESTTLDAEISGTTANDAFVPYSGSTTVASTWEAGGAVDVTLEVGSLGQPTLWRESDCENSGEWLTADVDVVMTAADGGLSSESFASEFEMHSSQTTILGEMPLSSLAGTLSCPTWNESEGEWGRVGLTLYLQDDDSLAGVVMCLGEVPEQTENGGVTSPYTNEGIVLRLGGA
ncbi:MAG: hypothetical protein KC912_14255 [Proteobacteria bacterium]|nr:hypothetical protein [Pseudomonadota bacterium]